MLSQYIRNILYFMIFVTCVGIIIPNAKYKKYIDMVMGLILILLVMRPVAGLLSGGGIPVQRIFSGLEGDAAFSPETADYEALRNDMLKQTFDDLAVKQMQSLLDKEGKYSIQSAEIETAEDYGQIQRITLFLQDIETGPGGRLIWIEPVRIGAAGEPEKGEEQPEIKSVKKIISDFYNLSPDNIHITVVHKGTPG